MNYRAMLAFFAAPMLAFLWGVADPHVTVGPVYLGERYDDVRAKLGNGTAGKLCEQPSNPASCVQTLSYGDGASTAILQFDPGAPAHNLTSVTVVMKKSNAAPVRGTEKISDWKWEGAPIARHPAAKINGWQAGVAAGKRQLLGFRRFDSAHTFQALFHISEADGVDQFVVAMLG